jgi:hypothetical protein
MSIEFDIYTGTLKYKEIEFSFVFDRKELRLIPPEDKYHDVHMWFMKPLGKGAYTFGNPVYIEDDYLIGKCNENCQKIIFLPKYKNIVSCNSVLIIQIEAYIIQRCEREWIDRLGFTSPEIDCIFPTSQALEVCSSSGLSRAEPPQSVRESYTPPHNPDVDISCRA